MTARSIPEILGWQRADDFEVPSSWWVDGTLRDGWTVDDLLAWLRAQGYDVTTKVMRFASDEPIVWAEAANRKVVKKAPTLLAALEAAVRAVDSTTPPHPVKGEGASLSQGSDDG